MGQISQEKERRLHFYASGLGDGSIHVQNENQQDEQQGLRGRKRTRVAGSATDDKINRVHGINHEHDFRKPGFERKSLDDVELYDAMRSGRVDNTQRVSTEYMNTLDENIPNQELQMTSTLSSDEPWQFSVVVLLSIMGILIALFIHYTTDTSTHKKYSFMRSRTKKKIPFKSPNYKKKTDEWSDDATDDDDYRGDSDEMGPSTTVSSSFISGNIAKKRMNIPPSRVHHNDPTARLYYNVGDNFRQQENRLRKSTTSTQQQQNAYIVPQSPSRMSRPMPSISSTNVGNRGVFKTGAHAHEISPRVTHMKDYLSDRSPRGDNYSTKTYIPTPPFLDSGVGSGLEGFEHSVAQEKECNNDGFLNLDLMNNKSMMRSFEADQGTDEPVDKRLSKVRPMGTFTPTESFAAMPSDEDKDYSSNTVQNHTLSITKEAKIRKDTVGTKSLLSKDCNPSSSTTPEKEILSPRRISQKVLELDFPTPRVENSTSKRQLEERIFESPKEIAGLELPFGETDENKQSTTNVRDSSSNFLQDLNDMPLVPNLNSSPGGPGSGGSQRSIDAPRSVLLEELHLIRMESGVQGPRWVSEAEVSQNQPVVETVPSMDSPLKNGGQNYMHPMFGNETSEWYNAVDSEVMKQRRQVSENEAKLREASSVIDPADDPRNSIQHIRKDLTEASDTSSSLSSRILFSELKLLEVIGGGGFGQVWGAKWKGTPVAVKVLTGAAQVEAVPKAVIEEFIAEINMVSGMRHPNICLFMGACLDPPNRAIVTELCENGSLWDALRSPLSSPYQAADGTTRKAWPLSLYNISNQRSMHPIQSNHNSETDPPIAPVGGWPWILVKRVASGTARGMCYLHDGNPPVLHRDLKSANILLDESYTAKLADFGLSRLKAVRSGMTGNCGTVQWMAPEVLSNEEYAEPADVFSYGIILWEMLTRECPYEGMTPIQCALSVLNENNRPKIPDWCPQSFRALIKNCVERNPKDRPTFIQILAALDSLD